MILISKTLRTLPVWVIALAIVCCFALTGNASERYPEVSPDPVYTPGEVVGIQMRALGHNDRPYENAGIELTFRFASPQNRQFTGPLERFTRLFENVVYKPMLNHVELEMGEGVIDNGNAQIPVVITDADGMRAGYLFTLTRQSSEICNDCWMTDTVVRLQIPEKKSPIL